MRISAELEDARLNVAETAALANMDAGHFRRLIRRGVFPSPKRTQKGLPYFDYETLLVIADVVKRRVGCNGEEVMWYRRKPKTERHNGQRRQSGSSRASQGQPPVDDYIQAVIEGCRQLGVAEEKLTPEAIQSILTADFEAERPALERAIPVVARRLLAG